METVAPPARRYRAQFAADELASPRLADAATQAILLGMVVFSPLALATTVPWAIWIMNAGGLALGGLLALKWTVRLRRKYEPARWEPPGRRWIVVVLGSLTVAILGWCLLSAANARSVADPAAGRLEAAGAYVRWLPHSLDGPSTWSAFWMYLSLASAFWAARDWLAGMTRREAATWARASLRSAEPNDPNLRGRSRAALAKEAFGEGYLPKRWRRLLWTLSLTAGAVAIVALFQRLQGTDRLLWIFTDPLGRNCDAHWGPFPYRNNGAAYANLVWPVCLGLWWLLRVQAKSRLGREARWGGSPRVALPLLAVFLIAGPIIASSRGGSLVALGSGICLLAGLATQRDRHWRPGLMAGALILIAAFGLAGWLGWEQLSKRLFLRKLTLATGHSQVSDLSLRCVFDVVPRLRESIGGLVGLSDTNRIQYGRPGGVFLDVHKAGALEFGLFDAARKRHLFATLPGFLSNYVGQTVEVVAVRQGTNGWLYLNGELVETPKVSKAAAAVPPGTLSAVPAGFLWVGALAGGSTFYPGSIHYAALFDRALTPPQIRQLAFDNAVGRSAPTSLDAQFRPIFEVEPNRFDLERWWTISTADRRTIHRLAAEILGVAPPLLGSGPGTFARLWSIDPRRVKELVDLHVHNDWLETRLTFGWIGYGLVLLALATGIGAVAIKGGVTLAASLRLFLLVPLAGCLVHAREDFPLQNYAILFAFLLLVCLCSLLGRPAKEVAE